MTDFPDQTEAVNACAEIVRRGDPDRFLAAMAASPATRALLFPLYAFNVEVARAPWVSQEPLVVQMRLQWWRDALAEIADRGIVRRHEVTTPLAHVLDAEGAACLDALILARHADLDPRPFADEAALSAYLEATAAGLMWTAARLLGATDEAPVRAVGRAAGLAAWLQAVPALRAAGRQPLPDESPARVSAMARNGLAELRKARPSRPAAPAVRAAWQAAPLLRLAARDPSAVAEGRLVRSEFARRASLMGRTLLGR